MTRQQFDAIQDGIARGQSYREIAARVRVSRASVGRVARGEVVRVDGDEAPRAIGTRRLTVPVRCPGCGAKLDTLPCLACSIGRKEDIDGFVLAMRKASQRVREFGIAASRLLGELDDEEVSGSLSLDSGE